MLWLADVFTLMVQNNRIIYTFELTEHRLFCV
jgi:hypothetical protein